MNLKLNCILMSLVLLAVACSGGTGPGQADSPSSEGESGATSTSPGTSTTGSTLTGDVAVTGAAPQVELTDCRFNTPPGTKPVCGTLEVPLDHAVPGGPSTILRFAVFPATNRSGSRPDPVVYLDGGPGGHTLDLVEFLYEPVLSYLNDDRDVIVFDQRGVGLSEPALECPDLLPATLDNLDVTDEVAFKAYDDVLRRCHTRLAEVTDLSLYNSAQSASDVDSLRAALGYAEWNLLGISYGTRLALTVMRDHPQGVRSVILDSTVPIELDGVASIPASGRRAFEALSASCANDLDCSSAFPDLEQALFDTADALDASPLFSSVVDVLGDPRVSHPERIVGQDLFDVTFSALYDAEQARMVPTMIDELRRGDTRTFDNLNLLNLLNLHFISIGMFISVDCHEEVPFSSPEKVAAAMTGNPRYDALARGPGTQGPGAFETCGYWQAGTAPPIENQPVSSDIPTLVLAGELDPITPPADGRRVSGELSNSTFLEFPGMGHGVSPSPCGHEVVSSFLETLSDVSDESCISGLSPLDFPPLR